MVPDAGRARSMRRSGGLSRALDPAVRLGQPNPMRSRAPELGGVTIDHLLPAWCCLTGNPPPAGQLRSRDPRPSRPLPHARHLPDLT